MKFKITSILIILLLWFAAFASMWSPLANRIALYIALPLALVLTFFQKDALNPNRYYKILLALLFWVALSYFWAMYKQPAVEQLKQILGTGILCFIFATLSKNKTLIPFLYIVYILLFITSCIYAKDNILGNMTNESDRLSDDRLNANTLAYLLFYLTFVVFDLRHLVKFKILQYSLDVLFILLIPLTFIIALLTASRQVLLIQIPLIMILLSIRYLIKTSVNTKILFIASLAITAIVLFEQISSIYDASYLKERNEMSISGDSRTSILGHAIKVGFENFPLGVGAGNYICYSPTRNFSHNTYTELFANEGIIGLALYLCLMGVFIFRQLKRYREKRDKQYLAFLTFGVVYAFDGFFYVFYPHLWLMGAFILVASYSETYYRNKIDNEKGPSLFRLTNSKYPSR